MTETSLIVTTNNTNKIPEIRNKSKNLSVFINGETGNENYVVHLNPAEVEALAGMAGKSRHGERDSLLIRVTFDAALRISETLGLRMCDLDVIHHILHIHGKGDYPGVAAVSAGTVEKIGLYAWNQKLDPHDRIFPISRTQAYRIITTAYDQAAIRRPTKQNDHVGPVHILRHSGAIERLKKSGNPRSIQAQLRHRTASTTMRYLKTISQDESMAIQGQVDPW
jgi:integrase